MPLLIDHEMPSGVVVSFWRITDINIAVERGSVTVRLSGYLSAQHYADGKEALTHKSVVIRSENLARWKGGQLYGDIAEAAHALVLEDDFFTGAEITA